MKKFIGIILAVIMTAAIGVAAAACTGVAQKAPSGYVAIDINPSIELTSDANGNVATVKAANEDARILLAGTNLKGKSVKEAGKTIAALAEEMGYMEKSNHKVTVLAAAENGKDEQLLQVVKEGIAEGSEQAQITDQVKSLEREVKKLQEANPQLYQNLTAAKLRLIRSIQTWDKSFTLEQGAAMSVDKLKDILDDLGDEFEDFVSDELEDKYEALYDAAKEEILIKIDEVYGKEYAALAALARALERKADEFEDILENAEIKEEDIQTLAEILSLQNTDVLKDENGKITAQSVENYLDALEDEWDKADIDDDEAEDILDAAEEILERYDDEELPLNQEMLNEIALLFENAQRECPEFVTAEDLEDYSEDVLEKELEEMKEGIQLTAEQKEQIKQYENEIKGIKAEIKTQMKAEIEKAKAKLQEKKEQLLQK